MIDFTNKVVFKLKQVKVGSIENNVEPLLVDDEELISAYKSLRDIIVFTTKRIIAINVQGITGKKIDYTSLPYSKIQVFSVETAGTFDLDSELEMYFSGLGKVKFEFSGESNIVEIGQMIGSFIL